MVSFALIGSVVLSASSLVSATVPNDHTVINKVAIVNFFEGWGTSLAWWGIFAGGQPDNQLQPLINLLFSQSTNATSLRLNILRYNIGGTQMVNPDGTSIDVSLRQYRGVPSYIDQNGNYNWNADPNQMNVLKKAVAAGVNVVEAFSNSPPWFMTVSQQVEGNPNGGDNLDPSQYQNFADYIVTVTLFLLGEKIPVKSLEPFNEPVAGWWTGGGGTGKQEGCHFDYSSQTAFLNVLKPTMDVANISNIVDMTASDENNYNDAVNSNVDFTNVKKLNTHSYGSGNDANSNAERVAWASKGPATNTRRWMSEVGGFGDSSSGTVNMVTNIMLDINHGRATGWVYWQAMDEYEDWSLIQAGSGGYNFDPNNFNPTPNNLFYGYMQLTNHILPGSQILSTSRSDDQDPCTVCAIAAWQPRAKTVTVVLANNDANNDIQHMIDLTQFTSITTKNPIAVYRTQIDSHVYHQKTQDLTSSASTLNIKLPKMSVTTIVIGNATLA